MEQAKTQVQKQTEFPLPKGPLCEVILKFESGEEMKYNYTNCEGQILTIFGAEENFTAGTFDANQAAQHIVTIAESIAAGLGVETPEVLEYLAMMSTIKNPLDTIIGSILEVIEGEGRNAKRSRRRYQPSGENNQS